MTGPASSARLTPPRRGIAARPEPPRIPAADLPGGLHWLTVARAAIAGALLIAPEPPLAALKRSEPDRARLRFARILGARQGIEAALLWRYPTPAAVRTGAVVDGIHAVTALGIAAVVSPRRLALLNCLSATGFALAGWQAATAVAHATRERS